MSELILSICVGLATVHLTCACQCMEPVPGQEVCGSDGNTWPSICHLLCTNWEETKGGTDSNATCLSEIHKGNCTPSPCICNDTCQKVCASNGKTYNSQCAFECAQRMDPELMKTKNGECGVCVCTWRRYEVCGNDGVTYRNYCRLKCVQELKPDLKKAYGGPCNISTTTASRKHNNVGKFEVQISGW